jgi:hypothetical protein
MQGWKSKYFSSLGVKPREAAIGFINVLNTSSLSIINTSSTTKDITVAVGDTGFVGPVIFFQDAGSGVWQGTAGSKITLNWFLDAGNAQGASTATDTPGTLIDTFNDTAAGTVDSFSHDGEGPLPFISGPFSMTEQAVFDLAPGGELLNRGQTLIAFPEPSTWVMMLLGFAGVGYVGFRSRNSSILSA